MLADPFVGLFEQGFEIDSPGGEHERNARALAELGLVSTEEKIYVRCWNTLDRDYYAANAGCAGRVYVQDGDDEYECPECGRELRVSLKHRFSSIRLVPDLAAMRRFIGGRLRTAFEQVEERPAGVFRIPAASADLMVLLIDAHAEQPLLPSICPCSQRVMLVAGRRPCGLYRAATIPSYRLAEIALGVADTAFLRTLRRLATRIVAAPVAFGPSSLAHPADRVGLTTASNTNSVSLQAPPGLRWSEVTLYLVNGETIVARFKRDRLRRFHHYDVDLADRRSGKPNKKWRLLEALCENFGHIDWRGHAGSFDAFKQQVSGLRHVMQTIFGIHSDPFKHCKKRDGLITAFQAFPELPHGDRYDESLYDEAPERNGMRSETRPGSIGQI